MNVILIAALLLGAAEKPLAPEDVGPYMQSLSVNIKGAGPTQGSGTIFLRQKKGGGELTFAITACHVVHALREVKTTIGDDGEEKKLIRYGDAQIVQEKQNDAGSRVVGFRNLDAKVLSTDDLRDIALLQVRASGEFHAGATFKTAYVVLPLDSEDESKKGDEWRLLDAIWKARHARFLPGKAEELLPALVVQVRHIAAERWASAIVERKGGDPNASAELQKVWDDAKRLASESGLGDEVDAMKALAHQYGVEVEE